VDKEDLVKFNEMLDKLTQNKFFEYHRELRGHYQYLAENYHFDLKTHTVDPATGEIVPINSKDKFYFDRWLDEWVFDLRILLVDDNKDITEIISFYCQSEDIDCNVINQGKKVLDSIRHQKFDLILLDVAMPEFSGLDVIKSLKEERVIESRNIVIFTASSDQTVLDEIKNSGIKEIFQKPFSLNDFIKLIEKYRPRY
jgi:two-component system OmpR family response regulator